MHVLLGCWSGRRAKMRCEDAVAASVTCRLHSDPVGLMLTCLRRSVDRFTFAPTAPRHVAARQEESLHLLVGRTDNLSTGLVV
ncbi:unnamed protein product [Protopolystoma xenopodis]|uniref:Uncharacterized protein n=1 Tax=Protopolystoma xenopodis TaxID=117903 RepID=A0A448X716_9PLAT|nr:unnamed protein product [Protopolystoma xenopodis]